MLDDKLEKVARELISGGDAYKRAVNGGGDPSADLAAVIAIAKQRGLAAGEWQVDSVGTPPPDEGPQMIGAHLAAPTVVEQIPDGWLMEPKLDGFWLQILHHREGQVVAWTRAGARIDERIPHICELMGHLAPGTRLVGELVHRSEQGSRHVHGPLRRTTKAPADAGCLELCLEIFDCLENDGDELTGADFRTRRSHADLILDALEEVDPMQVGMRLIDQRPASADAYHAYVAEGYEGAVVKDPDATYQPGQRGRGMSKIKTKDSVDVVVIDWLPGTGEFQGMAGSLVVGQHAAVHVPGDAVAIQSQLTKRGRVSSGLDFAQRRAIAENFDAFRGRVLELRHMGVDAGGFRHPTFLRWRDDLSASEVEVHDGR